MSQHPDFTQIGLGQPDIQRLLAPGHSQLVVAGLDQFFDRRRVGLFDSWVPGSADDFHGARQHFDKRSFSATRADHDDLHEPR